MGQSSKKSIDFEEISFYPLEVCVDPIAPPKIVESTELSNSERITQILRYNNFLVEEIARRESAVLSFKRFEFFFFYSEMIVVIFDILLGVLGVVFPNQTNITAPVCVFLTTLTTFLRSAAKKFSSSLEKHQNLLIMTRNRYITIKEKYENVLRDGQIDDTEYFTLVKEFKNFEDTHEQILSLGKIK